MDSLSATNSTGRTAVSDFDFGPVSQDDSRFNMWFIKRDHLIIFKLRIKSVICVINDNIVTYVIFNEL